jgi:hypothetical protein
MIAELNMASVRTNVFVCCCFIFNLKQTHFDIGTQIVLGALVRGTEAAQIALFLPTIIGAIAGSDACSSVNRPQQEEHLLLINDLIRELLCSIFFL